MSSSPYGLMAEFDNPERLIQAARAARAAGYRRLDAYTPMPVPGLAESLGFRSHGRVALIVLLAGMAGAMAGYGIQYYSAVVDFPINTGGRPLNSWPYFMPVTIEVGMLFGALAALMGLLVLNRLPRLNHPVFNVAEFDLATRNRFFLCIEADDPAFDAERTRQFLSGLSSVKVLMVPAEESG